MYRVEGYYWVCAAEDRSPPRGCLVPGLSRTGRHVQQLTHLEEEIWHKGLLPRQTSPCIYQLDTLSLSGFCLGSALRIQGSDNHIGHFGGVAGQTGDKAWQIPMLSHGIITTSISYSREEAAACSCGQRCLGGVGVHSKHSSSEADDGTCKRAPCHPPPLLLPLALLPSSTKTCFSGGGQDPLKQLHQPPSVSTWASTSEPCSICFSSR